MSEKKYGKVALLQGGTSPEREISLSSAKEVGGALDRLCEKVVRIDPKTDEIWSLKDAGYQMVFNILHGGAGEDGCIQAVLELMEVPFTGSEHLACALAMDKDLSKTMWLHEGLATPMWVIATDASDATLDKIELELGQSLFVKPNNGGSSIATRKTESRTELADAIENALSFDSKVMVEEGIEGQELTYGIVGDEVLPGIKIEVDEGFYDYEAKYVSDTTRLICPTGLAEQIESLARELSLESFRCLGCVGWGRVDLVARGREVFLLEVNTIPGMTDHSLVPRAAKEKGWDMVELVDRIMGQVR